MLCCDWECRRGEIYMKRLNTRNSSCTRWGRREEIRSVRWGLPSPIEKSNSSALLHWGAMTRQSLHKQNELAKEELHIAGRRVRGPDRIFIFFIGYLCVKSKFLFYSFFSVPACASLVGLLVRSVSELFSSFHFSHRLSSLSALPGDDLDSRQYFISFSYYILFLHRLLRRRVHFLVFECILRFLRLLFSYSQSLLVLHKVALLFSHIE